MKFQKRYVLGILLVSMLFASACFDEKSSSAPEETANVDPSSPTDNLNTEPSETDVIKKKYGKCNKKNDGLVVKNNEEDEHKYVCKDSTWTRVTVVDYGEKLLWWYLGSCTDKEEGELRLPKHSATLSYASIICKNHSWEEIDKDNLPKCNSDYFGEVVYLSDEKALICDKNKKWRTASNIEAPNTPYYYSWMDTVPGLCYKERIGEMVKIDYNMHYKCTDSLIWEKITSAEYIYGECKGIFKDSIVEISISEKYICQDTGWRSLNLAELGLGICTKKREKEMGTSAWAIGNMTFVCENNNWRDATLLERIYGVCTKEKEGEVDSIFEQNEYKYYTCKKENWTYSNDDEILSAKLSECTNQNNKCDKTIDNVAYFCENGTWRLPDTLEKQIGFCGDNLEAVEIGKDSIEYICTKDGWKKAEPIEVYVGLCLDYRDGEEGQDANHVNYICENGVWRIGDELEQEVGFCTEYRNGQTITMSDDTIYVCKKGKWVSDKE